MVEKREGLPLRGGQEEDRNTDCHWKPEVGY